jgi:ATP-dependent Zn protease
MSRFFKSAAFPILIVVVLAFFAQRLISPGTQQQPPSYGDFIQQLGAGQVKTVDMKTKDNTLQVKLGNGTTYETATRRRPPTASTRDSPRRSRAARSRTTTSRARRATAGCRCSPTSSRS